MARSCMDITVCGPNLRDEARGEFHIHATNCQEVANYGPGRRLGGEEPWRLGQVLDRRTVVEAIYAELIIERGEDPDAYLDQLHFCTCCKRLPARWPNG